MQKTPLYKRCLPALALLLALMLPLVSLAEVSKVVKGGALNMRAEPSLSAQVLRQYPTGTWMTVLEDMGRMEQGACERSGRLCDEQIPFRHVQRQHAVRSHQYRTRP